LKVTQDEVVEQQTVLHIEVDSEQLERHMSRAYGRLVQRTNVPGFRKGKAPRHILERVIGRDNLLDEAVEMLTPEAIADALKEQDLEPVMMPRVTVEEREPVLKLSAAVALAPTVELGEYSGLRFDERPEPVTDEQVDSAVENVREGHATWEPADRPLALGDLSVLGVKATVGERSVIEVTDAEYLATEDSRIPAPGFPEALVGMSTGETKEFNLNLPEDFGASDVAGQEAAFEVSVSEIKGKVLPPLDDELAKNIGDGLETLTDLRNRIRENLEASADNTLRRSLEDLALDALVNGATIALPPMLVDHEAEHVLQEQQQALAMSNVPMSAYMERVGKSEEDLISEARETADRRLRRSLVLDELADAESIEVPEEDVETELTALKARRESGDENAPLDEDGARTSIGRMLSRRLAMDYMVELVRRDDGDATPEDDTADKDAETAEDAQEDTADERAGDGQ